MAAPPIPPRPFDDYDDYVRKPGSNTSSPAPVIPPLPADFNPQSQDIPPAFPSKPHYEDPLVAPRPQKLQPGLPTHVSKGI